MRYNGGKKKKCVDEETKAVPFKAPENIEIEAHEDAAIVNETGKQ